MTKVEDMIAADARAYAARTPGTQVVIVGELAVTVVGAEPPPGAVDAFVAHIRGLDLDGP